MMKNKTILITGGRGFVGSNLSNELSRNNNVIVFDNDLYSQCRPKLPSIKYFDLCHSNVLEVDLPRIDYIVHLGEYSRVEQSFDDITLLLKNNLGTIGPLLQLWRHHQSKFIYSGSSTKFGKYKNGAESPSPYSLAKVSNVNLIKEYASWYSLPHAITYFYNVYGPGENGEGKYATVIEKFLRQVAAGEKVTIHLPGTQTRNFTHVDDIISGLQLVMQHGVGDGYGLGSREYFSILDVAKILDADIHFKPSPIGNRYTATLNISKTEDLGWKTRNNLVDYLKERMLNFNKL